MGDSAGATAGSADGDYVCGIHAVRELLATEPGKVARLWLQAPPRSKRLNELAELAREHGVRTDPAERRWLAQRAGDGVPHQGVVALCLMSELATERELLARVDALTQQGAEQPPPLLLVLDSLQDARNLGACLRSADAAGVSAVVIPKRRSAPLNALARRAAAGAADHLFIASVANLPRVLGELRKRGVWVYGAAGEGAMDYCGADLAGPTALVLGGEEAGLRRLVREQCDALLAIPMAGAVSSLNVSVATGILLFEAVRQRAGQA